MITAKSSFVEEKYTAQYYSGNGTVSIDNFFKNLFQLFLGYQEVNLKKKFISRNTSVYETKILWKDFVKLLLAELVLSV